MRRVRRAAVFAAGLAAGFLLNRWTRALLHAYGFLLLAAICPAAHPAHACGTERAAVKQMRDAAAHLVDFNPTHITVPVMAAFKLHAKVKGNEPRGVEDEEFQTFQLDAIVTLAKPEADRDYHLVLKDDDTDVTMIGESVDPACARGSIALAEITAVREAIDAAGGPKALVGHRVHVSGVGFYDALHGERGASRNGLELHPLLSLEVR